MSFPETVVLTFDEVKTKTATQRAPLGTRGVLPDGRVFRYAKAGAAITANKLVTGAAPAGNYFATSGGCILAATTYTTTWRYVHIRTSHQCDATAEAADTYKDGYMLRPDSGAIVKIKKHDGTTASSTYGANFYFEDDDRMVASITGTDACMMIVKNPYDDVIPAGAVGPGAAVALGSSLIAITTAQPYFWLQTWGPAGLQLYGTNVAGQSLYHSTETAGSAGLFGTSDVRLCPYVADCVNPAATAKFGLVMLKLSP